MDKILLYKEKSDAQCSNEIIDKFIRQFSHVENIIASCEQRLTEDGTKIETLTTNITQIKDNITDETKKNEDKLEDICKREKILKDLHDEFNRLVTENQSTMSETNKLKKKITHPNQKDQETLERSKKKLDYYKILSGIRWDYSVIKTSVKGYVTNRDDYVHAFCLDRDDNECEEKLWLEVAKGSVRLTESEIQQLSSPIL